MDYAVLEGYTLYQKERCQQCGNLIYVCHSDHPNIRFRIEEDVCEARKQIEIREESDSEQKIKREHGSTLRAIPYTVDGSDFADYRTDYYRGKQADAEEVESSLRFS